MNVSPMNDWPPSAWPVAALNWLLADRMVVRFPYMDAKRVRALLSDPPMWWVGNSILSGIRAEIWAEINDDHLAAVAREVTEREAMYSLAAA